MNRKNYIDTKEQANRNVQYITYVKIIALVLLTVLGGLFVWQPKVSALTTSDIPGSLDTVIKTYDNGTQDCAGGVADSNNPVGCSDCAPPISREYGYYGWLSPAGDPTSMNTVTLPSGSTTLPLQFNLLTFLCHTIVNVDPNRPVNGLPYDGNPSDYAMTSSNFHFDSISVTNNANGQAFGTVTNSPVGGILAMGYPSNTNTRYWFTTTTPFNGGQSLPDATPITLSIPP
ncbi:MAG TPA: hypothetical protein VFN56_02505, partial [Candidatus Saccharimonadales bacterium]|nr:hypothetical protein [Candidatus Saccharimonadales bacterium]